MSDFMGKPGMVWVNDREQTIIVEMESGQAWTLRDSEALIWNWLAVGYSAAKLITLVALTLGLSETMAAVLVSDTLHGWVNAGLVDQP